MLNKTSPLNLIILVLISFLFHLLEITSIIDIHFKTPIVQNLKSHNSEPSPNTEYPKAKRAIMLLLDGARADNFFEEIGKNKAPYFKKIATELGVRGISHPRVPTETRPCIIAATSGFYEDPSNMITGLSYNAVPFDNIFNHSKKAFGFGGLGGLMFIKKVPQMDYYGDEKIGKEDFGSSTAYLMDKLTLEIFDKLVDKVNKGNKTLEQQLKINKTTMFFHMESLDSYGHASKCKEIANHINFLSNIIEKFVNTVENFYKDNSTVYVLTSDHGMNDRASHGGG